MRLHDRMMSVGKSTLNYIFIKTFVEELTSFQQDFLKLFHKEFNFALNTLPVCGEGTAVGLIAFFEISVRNSTTYVFAETSLIMS